MLPVEKYELTREPGFAVCAAAIARLIPVCRVTSPSLRNTATIGACSPFPNACRVRWFAS